MQNRPLHRTPFRDCYLMYRMQSGGMALSDRSSLKAKSLYAAVFWGYYPTHMCKVKWLVALVHLSVCLSVCLSARKTSVLQIQAVLLELNIFKLCKMLKNCLVCASFCRHAYRPHPDTCTWPPLQCEMMVSVFLGQRAFVRRRFVPILMEAHA